MRNDALASRLESYRIVSPNAMRGYIVLPPDVADEIVSGLAAPAAPAGAGDVTCVVCKGWSHCDATEGICPACRGTGKQPAAPPPAPAGKTPTAQQELTNARLAVSDWHNCASQEELWRWRQAHERLINAAMAVAAAPPTPSPDLRALAEELRDYFAEQPQIGPEGATVACMWFNRLAAALQRAREGK